MMPPISRLTRSLALTGIAILGACADSVTPKTSVEHLLPIRGGAQAGFTFDTLPQYLVVRVIDDGGSPVPGMPVTWSNVDETVRIIPVDPVTTETGHARATVILGFNPGPLTVDASVAGLDEVATFELTVNARHGFKAIALMRGRSFRHMCALDADSLAWCWGDNQFGQLGDGTTTGSEAPRQVTGGIRFKSIAGNDAATCALTAAGALWCWGNNKVGAGPAGGIFGNGSIESSPVPVPAASGLVLAQFDMEHEAVCGVATDGRGYCWGGNGLGTGTSQHSTIPLELAGGMRWREIAVGDDRRCAVAADWSVHCWTTSSIGQDAWWTWIGVSSDAGPENTPLQVELFQGATNITSSVYNQCGLSLDGAATAVCWGVLFTGSALHTAPGPTWLRLPESIRTILTEGETGFALDARGEAWAWGGSPDCCDGFVGYTPVQVFPGTTWSTASLAHGLHAISARDSLVYRILNLGFGFGRTPVVLVPMPAP